MPNSEKIIAPTRPCNLCGSVAVKELSNKSRTGNYLRTVICDQCGLVYLDPLAHDVRDFYEHQYRLDYKGGYIPKMKHVYRAGLVAIDRYEKIKSFMPLEGKVLDIGSGGGEFVYLLKTLGYQAQGVEPNEGYANYSRDELNLEVQVSFIQDIDFSKDFFDVVTIWHVLEHTEEPSSVLAKLFFLLKTKGILVIEVPNVEAVCQAPASSFHEAHIYNFSMTTLSEIAKKNQFTILHKEYSSDKGNITIILQKNSINNEISTLKNSNIYLPEHSKEIFKLIKERSTFIYYLKGYFLRRLLHRFGRSIAEKAYLFFKNKSIKSRKDILENLYMKK
jgi:2-polyprenyl-3-methyl-5-hydroxy-6-metoxy-1,4-benzoquinol methylase